jgi:hypothetical protein
MLWRPSRITPLFAIVAAIYLTIAFSPDVTSAALAQTEQQSPLSEPQPGEGVICAWAVYTAMDEVGRRCLPGESVEFQAELRRSVTRIDEYVIQNASPPLTPEQIAEFKRRQGKVGSPLEQLCNAEMVGGFRSFAELGAETLRTKTDALLVRPAMPTWGTCL